MSLKYWSVVITALILLLSAVVLTQPASANPPAQVVYQTPTPLPDGRILYIVQPNDSCLRIELLTGVTIEQLRTLNKLDQDCTLSIGKELLLAIVTPEPTATINPEISPTPLLPTPTPIKGNGIICLTLYNDINGDGFQGTNELLIGGGAISITDRLGQVSETGMTTTNPDSPFCKDVPEGEYTVSLAIPDGYNPTTSTSLSIVVQAGSQGYANFGAQISSKVIENQPSVSNGTQENNSTGSSDLLLAILGGLLILMGLALAIYILVMRRQA